MNDFLCLKWITKNIQEYGEKKEKEVGRRKVIFPKNLYSAALLHIYRGALSISEIADRSGMNPEVLDHWRTDLGFLLLTDFLKKECSEFIREKLLINDFTLQEYDAMGAEYSLLDEVVQNQIKVPLFNQMKDLAHRIDSRKRNGLPLDRYNLMVFSRLFTFFLFVEKHTHQGSQMFSKTIKSIAENIVWPELGRDWGQVILVLRDDRFLGDRKVKEFDVRIKNWH
ncbi:MAG TPA: hypothetical protein EYP21_03580 [Syntrophaceae bacterium]|nr:hypothetical protein [Syntrophaceae bacterium]